MIEVTSLGKKKFYLNPDLIYRIEEMPDTTITLVDSKMLLVSESAAEVVQKITTYRKEIYQVKVNGNEEGKEE